MQLQLGTYAFPVNGVKVTTKRTLVRGNDSIPWKFVDELRCDGYLQASGQAALTAASQQLFVVCATPFKDLILFNDDGSRSASLITNANSITGVIVTNGPNFPDVIGAEYSTQRHFDFTAEADYLLPYVRSRTLLDFQETVSLSGGGPLYRCLPALTGPPQRQMIYEQTVCVATQKGYAVGASTYPTIPGPIWPFALVNSPDTSVVSPKKQGKNYESYRVEWSYSYEWPFPLVALPNRWPLT